MTDMLFFDTQSNDPASLASKEIHLGDVVGLQNQWLYQWEFQDPKMEVPTIYKAYIGTWRSPIDSLCLFLKISQRRLLSVFFHQCLACLPADRPLVWDWPVCSLEPCAARHYPLVNIQKTMENHHFYGYITVYQLFLWPFSIANC